MKKRKEKQHTNHKDLVCPNCRTTGQVRTRIRTGERVCYRCGYVWKEENK